MAVQDAARGVANGLVEIVAFHQDREESGDRAGLEVSGALKNLGQEREHGRRITLLAGRLSRGQSDFALRHGQARHRIHHQQNVRALIAKIFRGGQRHERGANPQRRGTVGRRRHHHRTLHAFRAEFLIQKRLDLAIALADQRDHADLRRIFRDMAPSSVLLPTPLPPNRPMRWPFPQVSRLSMERMPVTRRSVMCFR